MLDDRQRRHLRLEMTIATVACSVLPTLAVSFLFEPFPVPLKGADGLVGFAFKSTLVAVLLMTLLMTLGVRAKMRKSGLPPLQRTALTWLAWVPRPLALRAPVLALAAALVLSALTAFVLGDVAAGAFDKPAFIGFNLVIGALIGLVMTPIIQCAALADHAPAAIQPPASARA